MDLRHDRGEKVWVRDQSNKKGFPEFLGGGITYLYLNLIYFVYRVIYSKISLK